MAKSYEPYRNGSVALLFQIYRRALKIFPRIYTFTNVINILWDIALQFEFELQLLKTGKIDGRSDNEEEKVIPMIKRFHGIFQSKNSVVGSS